MYSKWSHLLYYIDPFVKLNKILNELTTTATLRTSKLQIILLINPLYHELFLINVFDLKLAQMLNDTIYSIMS